MKSNSTPPRPASTPGSDAHDRLRGVAIRKPTEISDDFVRSPLGGPEKQIKGGLHKAGDKKVTR
jgi:hypothetical protein